MVSLTPLEEKEGEGESDEGDEGEDESEEDGPGPPQDEERAGPALECTLFFGLSFVFPLSFFLWSVLFFLGRIGREIRMPSFDCRISRESAGLGQETGKCKIPPLLLRKQDKHTHTKWVKDVSTATSKRSFAIGSST